MPRSKITSTSKDLITDDGSSLISIVNGEQIQMDITLSWLVNLTGYTITAKVVEADNAGDGAVPEAVKAGGAITTLTLLDSDVSDNTFKIILPENLISTWATQPTPDKPVYGFFGIEVADTGIGVEQQIWKPVRGLVEVLFSPTEA